MAFTKPIRLKVPPPVTPDTSGLPDVSATQGASGAGPGDVNDPKGLPAAAPVDPSKKKVWRSASGQGAVWNTNGGPRNGLRAATLPAPAAAAPVVAKQPDPLAPIQIRKDPPGPYDIAFEKSVVGGKNKSGKIVEISPGTGNGHASLTIHGINGAPDDLKSFDDLAIKNGDQAMIFAYDSHFRRLGPDAADLQGQLRDWLGANPNTILDVDAHSLGGRILVRTLGLLAKEGVLDGREIDLQLIAPYVNGDGAANSARSAPRFLQPLIRNLTPSQDIGTNSAFQNEIENVFKKDLPPGVRITVFTGGKDIRVPADDPRLHKVIDNLGASVVFLPDATHDSIVDLAAAYMQDHADDFK